MHLHPPEERTLHGCGRLLRSQKVTCTELVHQCLAHVDQYEPTVHAWVFVDRDGALRTAHLLDEELRSGMDRGPLHGMPVGIKDIIDVKGWPTACGSRGWADRVAASDAFLVQRLRAAGAILLGKTETTPYASFDPPVTLNPWNVSRTPGGSSSGSAAAVAYGGCLAALGSQTGGSITRPATYCGLAGYKPTYGLLSAQGFFPLAPTMDHPGPLAGTVRDLAIMLDVLNAANVEDTEQTHVPVQATAALEEPLRPPRLRRLRSWFDDVVSKDVQGAVDVLLRAVGAAGASITDFAAPPAFAAVTERHRTIMAVEAAAIHEARLARQPEEYGPCITQLLREGLATPAPTYARRLRERLQMRDEMSRSLPNEDVLVAPATTMAAPDAATTGDPAFNSPWSFLGWPVISFPLGLNADGLPVGVQFIAQAGMDWPLFQAAAWCERLALYEWPRPLSSVA